MQTVLIVGTVPETAGIGGVTIHIDRLIKWLHKKDYPVELCDYKKESFASQFKKILSHKVIHIHASNPYLRIMYVSVCALLLKKTIFTVHGDLGRFSTFKNLLDKIAVKLSTVPIVINRKSYDKAIKWNKLTQLLSAFIPPYELGYIPKQTAQQIDKAKKKGCLIYATNASQRSFDKFGNEIYGIDFLISYFQKIPNATLVISDPSQDYKRIYADREFENVIFINEPHSFYAVITKSDYVLRATSTDGDSLSVKEALYAQKKVIATDYVDRPDGTILFKYNDEDSFAAALCIADQQMNTTLSENTVDSIINLYKRLE